MVPESLRKGIAAAKGGRKGEARAAFRAVLAEDPTHETALLWLAYLADDPRASLAYIARALEAHPDSRRAHAALRWARRRLAEQTGPSPAVPSQATRPTEVPQATRPAGSRPPTSSARARRRTVRWWLPILWIFLSLLCISMLWRDGWTPYALIAMFAPSPTYTSTPTATPTPTPTSTPTFTPTPTPTATPTPTPTPTSTPTPTPTPTPSPTATRRPPTATPVPPPAPVNEDRWIDVDLTRQILTAYEGDVPVRVIVVSTGLPRTPTPTGQFRIWAKLRYDDMYGPDYYLPDVPYVMYFYGGYGLHGTYWHNNFGRPMSHGCINLPTPEAEWLFNWAEVGTLVNIHY
ncbi:MAG: L,D-transpeptidase family protein [Thermoflexales bacterium]|nr:L,D-transpeptidase family protein [Thermoflexales bacterium]